MVTGAGFDSLEVQNGVDNTSNTEVIQSPQPPPKRPAPLACVECRAKHLKCDGRSPCTRCHQSSLRCLYQKSRRGYKGPRRAGRSSQLAPVPMFGIAEVETAMTRIQSQGPMSLEDISQTNLDASNFLNELQEITPDFPSLNVPSITMTPESNSPATDLPLTSMAINIVPAFDALDLQLTPAVVERAINAYYHYCHASHPFLPPQQVLSTILSQNQNQHLLAAICFIASCHTNFLNCDKLTPTLQHLSSVGALKNGFAVQALLLYTIGLNAKCRREEAAEALTKALNMVLELGMHKRHFASQEGRGSAVMEESWRRTFWEIYCVDGMSAGALQGRSFVLYTVPTDVLLPCEEEDYLLKRIPTPRSLKEYDEAPFTGQEIVFSSFTYRIDAIRNLGKILSLPPHHLSTDPAAHEAQLSLANWRLHLPRCKEDLISRAGKVDEMLFQAKMITSASTILLHKPHSSLYTGTPDPIPSCAMVETSATHAQSTLYASAATHSARTIQSANEISDLIALPTCITSHTPFFTCVVVVASIVHTAQWASCMSAHHPCPARQCLQLDIGALKRLSGAWPLAQALLGQVQGVVAEVFAAKDAFAADERERAGWGEIDWDGELDSNITL